MTTAAAPADREHLAKLLGLLGSSFAGERDAAGPAAMRFLRERNLTWFDVIAPSRDSLADPQSPVGWRDLVRECHRHSGLLRPWEQGFIRDLAGFPHISPKQRSILHEIAERLGLREGVGA